MDDAATPVAAFPALSAVTAIGHLAQPAAKPAVLVKFKKEMSAKQRAIESKKRATH
jgi:hypothetical protein